MRNTDPSPATVRQVRQRDGHVCVRCAAAAPLSTQHRVARGMGGTLDEWVNMPANLITLCGSGTTGCHGWVEAHPREAKAQGLALSRWQLPNADREPVLTWAGWVLLDNKGRAVSAQIDNGPIAVPF